jgi:hypothetical protein
VLLALELAGPSSKVRKGDATAAAAQQYVSANEQRVVQSKAAKQKLVHFMLAIEVCTSQAWAAYCPGMHDHTLVCGRCHETLYIRFVQ